MRKTASGTMLALLSISILTLTINIQPVRAIGTIYIRANGSIDPPTASISTVDKINYALTDNIYDSIVVERSNIIFDGVGYTIQGAQGWAGIDLEGRSNVTIKNANIRGFLYGIDLDSSSNNSIIGNVITYNNKDGISLNESAYNNIFGNNITENDEDGIDLTYSNHNNIFGNNIIENDFDGIVVSYSSGYNNIFRNNITENDEDGIDFSGSSSYNSVYENDIIDNWMDGIDLGYSSNYNSIFANILMKNDEDGIDLYNSTNNEIYGNNIIDNWFDGIEISYSSGYNRVYGNNITNNEYGIYILASSNNTISENNIIKNGYDVYLRESSSNFVYHNNIEEVYVREAGYANIWDNGYPSGGNHWGDYNGLDLYSGPDQTIAGSDAIGDVSYSIDNDNQDNYPLMGLLSSFDATLEYKIQIVCNSTISNFQFNGTAIIFYVSGENGTAGLCRICVPTSLVDGTYKVFVNAKEVPNTLLLCSNSTHSYLYFTYNHSTQEIIIIPEFPAMLTVLLFATLTIPATIIVKSRFRRRFET